MHNPFYNEVEQRIRAGWRLLLQFFLMVACSVFLYLPLYLAGLSGSGSPFSLSTILPMAAGTVLSVWLAGKYLDMRPFSAFGQSWSREQAREFMAGLILGVTGIGAIFLVEWWAGWITVTGYGWDRIDPVPWVGMMTGFLLSMILVGYYEELMYRGYQVTNMAEGLEGYTPSPQTAILLAVGFSSIAFGLMHSGNPNADTLSTLNIMVAGAVFALPYVMTGRLGCSVGMHIGWNAAQGGVFGFAVSGIPFRGSLLQTVQRGPERYTGGAFGPEAGVMGLMGLALILVIFVVWLRFAGRWEMTLPLRPSKEEGRIKTDEQGS